jgi:hypothetical protein
LVGNAFNTAGEVSNDDEDAHRYQLLGRLVMTLMQPVKSAMMMKMLTAISFWVGW